MEQLTLEEVMLLHYKSAAYFGGASGLQNQASLEGALGRADAVLAYSESATLVVDAAVAIAAGIVTSHPFVDGNKRTALAVLMSTLRLNNILFRPPIHETTEAMMALAIGSWSETRFRDWVRSRF